MMLIREAIIANVYINLDLPLNFEFRNVEVEQIKTTINASLSHVDSSQTSEQRFTDRSKNILEAFLLSHIFLC